MQQLRVVPKQVEVLLSKAQCCLTRADEFLAVRNNAAHMLLLLTGWEHVVLAGKELDTWAAEYSSSEEANDTASYDSKWAADELRNGLLEKMNWVRALMHAYESVSELA